MDRALIPNGTDIFMIEVGESPHGIKPEKFENIFDSHTGFIIGFTEMLTGLREIPSPFVCFLKACRNRILQLTTSRQCKPADQGNPVEEKTLEVLFGKKTYIFVTHKFIIIHHVERERIICIGFISLMEFQQRIGQGAENFSQRYPDI